MTWSCTQLLHCVLNLPLMLLIAKISHQMAMKNPIHDVVDVQSLVSRHQLNMLHYWRFCILIIAHAILMNRYTDLSVWHAAPSNYLQHVPLSNRYAVLNHSYGALTYPNVTLEFQERRLHIQYIFQISADWSPSKCWPLSYLQSSKFPPFGGCATAKIQRHFRRAPRHFR